MPILFTDVETTGFYRSSLPPEHPSQPHIVQLAALLCSDEGRDIASFSFIVEPGIEISEEVSKIHGITTAMARKFGMGIGSAISIFMHLYEDADLLVAHNIKFDAQVLESAIVRGHRGCNLLKAQKFCTMEAATPIINMPPTERMKAAGFNKPKAPKLCECIKHFFGEELDGAHDAMVDVIACKRIYFHMKGLSNGKEDEARRA